MASHTDFIVGLMAQNTDALGFIPVTTIEHRYVANEQYAIQTDRRGRLVGYVLHGKPEPGRILTIPQAVIDVDHRNIGHGLLAVREVIHRAELANCRAVSCRCADDLDANRFWIAAGFHLTRTQHPLNRRSRAVHTYVFDLWPRLF